MENRDTAFIDEMRQNTITKQKRGKDSIIVGIAFIVFVTFFRLLCANFERATSNFNYVEGEIVNITSQILANTESTKSTYYYDFIVAYEENGEKKQKEITHHEASELEVGDRVMISVEDLGDGREMVALVRSESEGKSVSVLQVVNFIVVFFYIFGTIFILSGIKQYRTYSEYAKIQQRCDNIINTEK